MCGPKVGKPLPVDGPKVGISPRLYTQVGISPRLYTQVGIPLPLLILRWVSLSGYTRVGRVTPRIYPGGESTPLLYPGGGYTLGLSLL